MIGKSLVNRTSKTMITRKEIHGLHRKRAGVLYNHAKYSASILSRLTKELDKRGLVYEIDKTSPFHLFVNCWTKFSVHAGGFNSRMEATPLRENGESYNSGLERSAKTVEGMAGYLFKNRGMKDREDTKVGD